MRKTLTTFVAALLFCLALCAQPSGHDRYGVNTHVYEFLPETDSPAPAGYKPVYLSHYGRHGSRTEASTDGKSYNYLLKVFSTAQAEGLLTAQGDSLYSEVRRVNDAYQAGIGALTPRGVAEHKELAKRIYKRYKPVFKRGSKSVRVESSTTPRCIVSMASFMSSLCSEQGDLRYSMESGARTDEYIRKAYQSDLKGKVMPQCNKISAAIVVDTVSVLGTLFTDPDAARAIAGSAHQLQYKIFQCACEGLACGVQEDMFRYLPEDVCRKWWSYRIRSVYMRNGNSVEYGDYRMENSKALAAAMLTQAVEALESGAVAADLKFGHDYPLLGLVSWFGLEGVGERLGWDDLPEKWSAPMNIPFASNMQFVVYRKKGSPDLVKFVYNGVERKLGKLTPVSGPYYLWDDVKLEYMP